MDKPRFVRDRNKVCFAVELVNLSELGLVEDEYFIYVGEQLVGKLLKRSDGSYCQSIYRQVDDSSLMLEFAEQAEIKVVGRDGVEQASCLLELLDPNGEITVYSLPDGRRVEAINRGLEAGHQYALIVSPDLEIVPEVDDVLYVAGKEVFLLNRDWPEASKLVLDGEDFWTIRVANKEPEFAGDLKVRVKGKLQLDLFDGL
ncbi:MAG: hypothetical protein RMM17_10820 [Acidobacteriota bacterium]|nr:hypothetical protein [Blastocatellia bacterium]MDW8413164.1 hypothetical protein [Acidobacteriota bacterium]